YSSTFSTYENSSKTIISVLN
ncbi:hypothetical protein CISIN_1g0451062mg, partial [Citrus sinensis]